MNNVVLIGRLTKDPELRYIPNGTPVTRFILAVDRGLSKEKKEEYEAKNIPTADFLPIVIWGKQAENSANYLVKGSKVAILGNIQTGSYDDNGTRRYKTEIYTTRIEFLDNKKSSQNNTDNDMDFSGIEGFHPVDNDDIPF